MKMSVNVKFVKVLLRVVALLVAVPVVAGAADYGITDLGVGSFWDINNRGMAVGSVADASGISVPVVWSNGVTTYLAAPTDYPSYLPDGQPRYTYQATAINDSGQIAGTRTMYGGGKYFVTWSNGELLAPIGGINPYGCVWSSVVGITNSGQIVGWQGVDYSVSGYNSSFVWDNGVSRDIASPEARTTAATGVNEQVQIVGYTQDWARGPYRNFIWENGVTTTLNIGLSDYIQNLEINNLGQVIGAGDINGTWSGFIWQDGNLTLIGINDPTAINDFGQVVGGTSIWWNGSVFDLSNLVDLPAGWVLASAVDVNNYGQILLSGYIDGIAHSFLLTPDENSVFAVPEPSSLVLLLVGLGGSAPFLVRRRNTDKSA